MIKWKPVTCISDDSQYFVLYDPKDIEEHNKRCSCRVTSSCMGGVISCSLCLTILYW